MEISDVLSIVAVLVSAIGLYLPIRQRRRDRTADVEMAALAAAAEATHDVYEVARHADVVRPSDEAVRALMTAFESRLLRCESQLPREAAGLRRSVRAAMTNWFGGPAGAGLSPDVGELPSTPHDHYWWQLCEGYLGYVCGYLQYRQVTGFRRPRPMLAYEQWPPEDFPRESPLSWLLGGR